MIKMPSQSTWNPAFMPNSVADIISTKPAEAFGQPTAAALQPSLITAKFIDPATPLHADTSEIVADDLEDNAATQEWMEEDNSGHPELTNLRDALTTSLASPGGVELDEHPLHNAVSNHDGIEEEKADFPSEGPTPPSKHLSTMSFARTVSHEVNWGEDDEVDPEWNLHRAETDPFKLMAKSDRTNSFPQIPPAHIPATNIEPPRSEAEHIADEVEKGPKDIFGDHDNNEDADFFAQQSAPECDSNVFPAAYPSETRSQQHEVLDYVHTLGGDFEREEERARYEEGLPLVQSFESKHSDAMNGHSFADDGADGEDDFFAQVSRADKASETGFPEPHPLERKSTIQVMNSLHFQPHEQTHDILEKQNLETPQSSLHRATGGGIVVSASTVLSQVPGDPDASIHKQPDSVAGLGIDSGEGDLAARWKAALAGDELLDDDDELLADDEPSNSAALDPAVLFESDDEGFLEDTEDLSQLTSPPIPAPVTSPNGHVVGFDTLAGSAQGNRPTSSSSSSGRYLPSGTSTAVYPSSNQPYAPSAPLLTDLSRPAITSALPSPYAAPMMGGFPVQQPQEQRPGLPKAQSFADKSKGGYSSPYDLPMDVVKPRKRVSMQQMSRGYDTSAPLANAPPPRSSSAYTQPPPLSQGSTPSLSPPTSSHSFQQNQPQPSVVPAATQSSKPVKKSASGFFEDLPISSRPRPAPRHSNSHNTPSQTLYSPQLNQDSHFSGPPPHSPYSQPVQQPPVQPLLGQGLVAPERVSPYASLPTNNMTVPAATLRYSPAPPQNQTAPPPLVSQSRYSPAPPSSRPPAASYASAPPPVLAHQPRTSSPLAHFERSQEQKSYGSQVETTNFDRRSSSGYESNLKPHHLPPTREADEYEQGHPNERNYGELPKQFPLQPASHPPQGMQPVSRTPPPPQGVAPRIKNSPPKRATSSYLPHQPQTSAHQPQSFMPPKRSQTQSPGSAFAGPGLEISPSDLYQRPASVEAPSLLRTNTGPSSIPASTGRQRGFSQGINYIAPVDGRENDPMQRWKGAPVFVWGVGGTVVTSFPKDVPRYGISQTAPMMIRSPGEVKIRNIKDVDPLQERLATFPGPLKGKSKKKEIVTWLNSGIEMLEHSASYLQSISNFSHEDKRTEERILLWKILRVFIENDGTLEGNPIVEKAVRAVLSPGIDDESSGSAPIYATGSELSSISQSSTSTIKADPVDPVAVDQLRKYLLRGEREKAVWEAVDKRLWAHAMLISNTVSKELYKQVAQEFVQKEVKIIGDNTESLAALYEIFAGNFEESIDELVPPSARAGFQMVSTSNTAGPSKDALDGLNRWRETLGLVLSNRSTDDGQALKALGTLLSGYGRAEAAHICFLFARSFSVFGGVDDPQSSIVLVGSDHLRQPYEFDKEMEPILLSEVFEYGMSLSSTSNVALSSSHLSVYKLQHATILAEYGYREKALQYCEAIASSITSQTRRSPYHHTLLVTALDDLSKRLKQSPKDESSSWISKPSIDKVSGSVWATFNKFIAGDEQESAGPGSATGSAAEVGPFARIAGGTPNISRSPSNSDLYGSYNGGMSINGVIAATKTSSRYAPGAAYTPPAHDPQLGGSYGSQPRSSFEERSSDEHRRAQNEPHQQTYGHQPNSQVSLNPNTSHSSSSYTFQSPYTPSGNDSPYARNSSPYALHESNANTEQPSTDAYSSEQPVINYDSQEPSLPYSPREPLYEAHPSAYESPSSGGGYEPPASSGYEPPSYQPSTMSEEPDSPRYAQPEESTMNDDGDDNTSTRPAATRNTGEKTKAEKDREADEAFRKAAEADAAAAAAQPVKKGWGLGGWFGGGAKKEADMSQPNKPIRAKLGETSSFVYDPELKRWVNKKAGAENTPSREATPPPPKAGPPRTMSGPPVAGPTSTPRPGSGPPQRATSGSSEMDSLSLPASGSVPSTLGAGGLGTPPSMSRSASNGSAAMGPPSRPGTGMSNASSIDDLLGPPTAGSRKGAARKGKKGRGYVDVMGDKVAGS